MESVGGQVERSDLHSIPTSCPPAESPTVWAASAVENKAPFPPHVEKIICIISPSVRWKQNNNWFALFSVCVVKQLGINLRITVQLILNAKDGVCVGGWGGLWCEGGKGYTERGHGTKTLCFCWTLLCLRSVCREFGSPPLCICYESGSLASIYCSVLFGCLNDE